MYYNCDLNQKYEVLCSTIKSIMDDVAHLKEIAVKTRFIHWFTREILKKWRIGIADARNLK